MRYGWASWAVLVVVLIAVPVACTVTQAVEIKQDPEIHCNKEWCLVKKDEFVSILEGMKKVIARAQELEKLCGWAK